MTDIIDETAGWPDVPLIATRDLVLGGPDGPSNKQAIALAARTELLRESTEFLGENQKRTPLYFDSYAEASAAAATLPDGQVIEAPNADGLLSRFDVQSGTLAYKSLAADAESTSFTPAGAGAISRTVQDKMREWVSVKDYGAVV